MQIMNRRHFMGASAGSIGVAALAARAPASGVFAAREPGDDHRGPCSISSANGQAAVAKAMEMIRAGMDPADAVVAGVNIVEDDPTDNSVGLGGLPNEDGVVELDASVMHGPLHRAGAVASIRNIRNPSSVALLVLKRTDHVLIVGEGALRFAKAHGFKEENLLTEESRKAWLRWKENLSPTDDWLNDDQRDLQDRRAQAEQRGPIPTTTGTINCLALTPGGDLAGVTTTSGLSYKIPGRVGDSPIIGAGLYVDNAVGAGGATGRGEAVLQNCGAFSVVQELAAGKTPSEACRAVAKRIAEHTREKRLLDKEGRPNFNVTLYALRKDGAYGSASLWSGERYAVNEGETSRLIESPGLFRK